MCSLRRTRFTLMSTLFLVSPRWCRCNCPLLGGVCVSGLPSLSLFISLFLSFFLSFSLFLSLFLSPPFSCRRGSRGSSPLLRKRFAHWVNHRSSYSNSSYRWGQIPMAEVMADMHVMNVILAPNSRNNIKTSSSTRGYEIMVWVIPGEMRPLAEWRRQHSNMLRSVNTLICLSETTKQSAFKSLCLQNQVARARPKCLCLSNTPLRDAGQQRAA